jgi:hypothetical protein
MAKKNDVEKIDLLKVNPKIFTVTITGDTDLVLNKMDAVTERELTDARNDKAKSVEKPNKWERIITSIHWLEGSGDVFTEDEFVRKLNEDTPCITAHGVKEMLANAVVRSGLEPYSTKFKTNVNINGEKGSGLIPIRFSEHYLNELLMSPKKGKPVLARLNCFKGWSADIEVSFLDGMYSAEQITGLFQIAGFGNGIGSSRNAGFGRFHVENVK